MLWLATFLLGETARTPSHARRAAPAAGPRTERWTHRAAAALATVRTAFADYRMRRAAVRELNGLSDRMLHDIGMTRDDIPRVAREMTARRSRRPAVAGPAPAGQPERPGGDLSEGCCTP